MARCRAGLARAGQGRDESHLSSFYASLGLAFVTASSFSGTRVTATVSSGLEELENCGHYLYQDMAKSGFEPRLDFESSVIINTGR